MKSASFYFYPHPGGLASHRSHSRNSTPNAKSHRRFKAASLQSLTQIPQISRNCTPGVKSHRRFKAASLQRLTQIPRISQDCAPDVKSHRCSTAASHQSLTQIPQISRIFFGVKSHGGFTAALEKKHLFYPLKIHYHRFL